MYNSSKLVSKGFTPENVFLRHKAFSIQWPNYVTFLASFFYVGIIWLNHRAVFSRVRLCDRSVHLANLFLLLTSGLIPFPTALLSTALQRGTALDAIVAVEIYAAIGGFM